MDIVLILVLIGISVLVISVSIPLVLEKVKPNDSYGLRTPKTLSDEKIWYKANKYMGKMFIWTYSVVILLAILLVALKNILPAEFIGIATFILLIVPLFVPLVLSFLYLNKCEVSPDSKLDMKEINRQEKKAFGYIAIGLAILLLLIGMLTAGLSLPLILEKVSPNGCYGVRIEKTLNNEAIWYQANRFCGYSLLLAGGLQLLTALALIIFNKRVKGWVSLVISIASMHLPLVSTMASLIYTIRL